MSILKFAAAFLVCLVVAAPPSGAAPSERRIALVIGNANYQAGALPTTANDAGSYEYTVTVGQLTLDPIIIVDKKPQ